MIHDGELSPVIQRTLSDEAAARLRDAIKHGNLAPGTRLVERELAERLGVSRVPIREALQQLVEEGLVTKVPHRGTFVYAPSRTELEEISSLRVVLEQFVVARVIARWNAEHAARLRQIVEHMQTAAATIDLQRVSECDSQFHHVLWEIAAHGLLLEVVSGLRSRLGRFLYEATSSLPASELMLHVASHGELIDILDSGDVARAQAAITQHILLAKQRILNYYQHIWDI